MDIDIPTDANGHPIRFWWWTSGIAEDEDYHLALKYFEGLMGKNPPKFSPEGDMLAYWAAALSDYEEKRWPLD